MTDHFFENEFIKLHYYRFGSGPKNMLCFHGFGMHGKQFKILNDLLGHRYTFWGFDLPFHKETKLKDDSLAALRKGFTKTQLADIIFQFCEHEKIDKYSVIGYSMGSHYATVLVEEMPERIEEYIVAAPSSLHPGNIVRFFSRNKIGNKILESLILNEKATFSLLKLIHKLGFVDEEIKSILLAEVATPELRKALYGCFTALKGVETDQDKLIKNLVQHQIKSIFVFGLRDKNYLPKIGEEFFKKYKPNQVVLLDRNHEMIDENFAKELYQILV